MKKLDNIEFINRSKKIHNYYYDYSITKYINNRKKVEIICPIHGKFEVLPQVHLRGSKCKLCINNNIKSNNELFINNAKKIHGDKYNYSDIEYQNNETKIKIICPVHGQFEQSPNSHLSGRGCVKCSGIERTTTELFIKKSKEIHENKYNYSLVEYINNRQKVKIICKHHGVFEQKPLNHTVLKQGCPKCGGTKKLNIDDFINRSKKIHNNFYDYSKVIYINYKTIVNIICPDHGIFKQTPHSHLSYNGCPNCKASNGEKIIRSFLIKNNIRFEYNKKFKDCKYKLQLKFDFFLPDKNCIIEFDGHQHYFSCKLFGGDDDFEIRKIRDNIKNNYCKKNNIQLIRLNNLKLINSILKKELKIDG